MSPFKENKQSVTVTLDPALLRKLRQIAIRQKRSLSAQIEWVIENARREAEAAQASHQPARPRGRYFRIGATPQGRTDSARLSPDCH
jgi:hypothetical protein